MKLNKRFSNRYQFQAHYTYSEDKDTDSNERTATSVTVSFPDNPGFDFGLSERDVKNRFVLSGLVVLPYNFKLSGIVEIRSGRPWTAIDADADFANCGFGRLGFNCTEARGVVDGQLVGRNTFRDESVERIDLRLGKGFKIGNIELDVFAEVFNLLDENSFQVVRGFSGFDQRDPSSDEFGIADDLVTTPRQWQLGIRLTY